MISQPSNDWTWSDPPGMPADDDTAKRAGRALEEEHGAYLFRTGGAWSASVSDIQLLSMVPAGAPHHLILTRRSDGREVHVFSVRWVDDPPRLLGDEQ